MTKAEAPIHTAADGAKLGILPSASSKVLYLVRHAQGYHNVAGEADFENYKSALFKDAHLTEKGFSQAHALSRHVQAANIKVDLVVSSPMSRALQTAVVGFGTHTAAHTAVMASGSPVVLNGASHSPSDGTPLMVQSRFVANKSAAHPPVLADGAPPFISHELCREHLGVHPCDAREVTSYYRERYPAVDFSLVEEEQDVLWTADYRESLEEIKARGQQFLAWLMTRPERTIAVVSHSGFLQHTLTAYADAGGAGPEVGARLRVPFNNAEMRTMVVYDLFSAPSAVDSTSFAGGVHTLAE